MTEFEKPYVSVIRLSAANVIATSGTNEDDKKNNDNEAPWNSLYNH